MRTFILFLLAWLLLCAQAAAQQLTAAEYFVDTDPGVGNGTAVAINAGDVVSATYNVNGTGIPEGFHTLSTRFMDANGTWGIAVARLFYVYGSVTGGSDPAPPITAGEYFIDSDPGTGAATAFSVSQGDQVTAAFNVDGTGLLEGFHTMSVRLKDTEGRWGIAVSRLFYVYGSVTGGSDPAPPILAGEYFIDSDPGTDSATAFSVSQGDQVTAAFSVDGTGLLEGFHTMSVRLKDTEGHWGIAASRLFYVYGGNGGGVDPASPIAAAEYFFDVDPGVGNGTALPTGAPQDSVSVNTVIDASALPVGTHVLNIRFMDTDGHWGIAEARPFIILPPGALANDECLGATVLPLQAYGNCPASGTVGSTEEATVISASDCWGGSYPDVWYQVNSGSSPTITFDLTAVGAQDLRAEVYDGCGGTLLACMGSFPYDLGTTPNTNYWVRVFAATTAGGFSICASGAMEDCLGVVGGPAMPGMACDDGDANTHSDSYQSDCTCQGWDCLGVLGGTTGPGSPCLASNDPSGAPFYGAYDANCGCEWTDCNNVANGSNYPGSACDDGDASTSGDALDINCTCLGYDCEGVYNGTASLDNCGVCVGGTTGQTACVADCHGDFGGTAYLDNCATCVGGNTGLNPCIMDCHGDFGGTASVDNCGVCSGGNTGITACVQDCNSEWGGTAYMDNCATCVGGGTGLPPCVQDCNGQWGGTAYIDNCATCVGGTTGLNPCAADCHGDFGGTATIDNCGTCVGGNTGLTACVQDCNGQWGGTAYVDNCATCVGGTTGLNPCAVDCHGDFGGTATIDNCGTCVGGNTGLTACVQDCNGQWGGTAYIDNCAICAGGTTGLEPCAQDCNGDLGGTAYVDNCGTCVGGNTGQLPCVADCHGDFGGTAAIDLCNVCAGGNTGIVPNSSCTDCAGVPNGLSIPDSCGTCLLPSDPAFQTAVRTLSFTGTGNFQSAVLFPQTGEPSGTYTAEVIYTNSANGQLPLGYPRLILDYEGDGIYNGVFDRTVLMVVSDANDVTTTDGKRYRCTVMGLPTGTQYQTLIQTAEGQCITQIGPFNYPDVLVAPDLEIFANDISFSSPNPAISSPLTVYAKVHNRADFAAEGFTVHLVNEFEPGTVYPDITIPWLAAHDTITVSWNITTPNVVAWCPMHVYVDASNVITETNELNNSAIRPFVNGDFNVPGAIHVYASVDPAVSVINPASPYDSVFVSGFAYYSETAVALPDSSVAGATVTIPGHFGETYSAVTNSQGYFRVGVLAMPSPGTYTLNGTVTDYTLTGDFQVSYERVLGCQVGYSVGVSIDQTMQVGDYTINAILVGGTISGNITVTNSTCEDVTVSTRLDASQTGGLPLIGDVMVPPLATGETFTLPFSGIQFNTAGNYSICGTSDADFILGDLAYHSTWCQGLTVFPALPDIQPDGQGGIGVNNFLCLVGEPQFKIWNHGAVPTGAFDCTVQVFLDGNYQQTYTHTVPDMAPFSALYFGIPYTPPVVGNYSFVLDCDVPMPNGVVAELDETNNSATYGGSTIACQADLVVGFPCQLPVTPVDPTFPGLITYNAEVTNYGNAIAHGPIDVTFQVSTGGTYTTQYAGDLAPLASGTVSVSAPSVAPATAALTLTVDPLNTIPELNEGGSVTDDLCWEYSLGPDGNCGQSWSWNPSVLGQTSMVQVALHSLHLYTASDLVVRIEVSGPDIVGTALLGDVIMQNAGHDCWPCGIGIALPGSFLFSSEGTYHFTFTVDPDNQYTECNEGNNVLTRDVVITNLPDLRVLSQYINPSELNPDVNEPVTLDVTYENIGYGNLGSTFDLKVMANNDELATVADVPGLVTGGTHTVSIPVPFSSGLVGLHVFRAIIDANNEVAEGDEMNNEATRSIVVGAASNLFFQAFTASTQTPSIGQLVTLQAIVGNNGDLPNSGDLLFFYVTAAGDTLPIGNAHPVAVDSAGTMTVGASWTSTVEPTALIARIQNSAFLEFTYTDNEASVPMGAITAQLTATSGCPGGPVGTLTAYVIGGMPPYQYVWSNDSTGMVLHAEPGSFTVTITDAEGRTTTASGVIPVDTNCGAADCNGDVGGTAFLDNCNVCVGGNTGLTACVQDCNGQWGGTAYVDNCATCVGGTTGLNPCAADCHGDFGGTATIDNCGTCVGGNTGLTACVQDCNGQWGGTAFIDNCATCVGGTTGLNPCAADCHGDFGGTAYTDNCGTCVGGNTGLTACVQDCNGQWGGTAYIDNCATCVGGTTGLNPCAADCHGDFGGTAYIDNCATCVGGNTGLTACVQDCNGQWGGTAYVDNCATCVGGTTGLNPCAADCHGDFGGTAYTDNCGTCVGGNTGLTACVQDCNGQWGGTAYIDNCATCVGGTTGLNPCAADCHGDFGGTAFTDNCGICVGGNTGLTACVQDCNGQWGGTATIGTPCDDGNTGTQNDVYDANCTCTGIPIGPCSGYHVVVNITTDGNPAGLSWQVHDGANVLLASGAPAMANSLNSDTVCVGSASACYTFNLYDSFGDGITGGGWELRTTTGKLLLRDDFAAGDGSPSTPTASASYGSGHSFCLPEGPANIAASECGIFNNALGNSVYCTKVTGATQYQFEFSDPDAGFIRRIAVATNYVRFNQMVANPLVPGVRYFARVRSNVAGSVSGAHWGSGCEMGLGVAQTVFCSQLIQAPAYGHSCNETRTFNTNNSFIYAKPVAGANQYQFRIFNTSEGYDETITRSTYILQLKWNNNVAPPLINGSTYDVQVNVKVNGLYSGFCGNTCTITIDNGGGSGLASMEQTGFGEATLWPNPVRDGQVNLSITGLSAGSPAGDPAETTDDPTGTAQRITVDIQDIYGKQVFAKAFSNSGDRFSTVLQLSDDIASGVYLVTITVNLPGRQAGGNRTVQRLSIIR